MLALTGCSIPAGEHESPSFVVEEYLKALASGDATTAARLDHDAVEKFLESRTVDDSTTLRTDAVLGAAVERINGVYVESKTYPWASKPDDGDERTVAFSYRLGGERHESGLTVRWDAEDERWILADVLPVSLFSATATVGDNVIRSDYVPFTFPGVDGVLAPSPEVPPQVYLVYPGVYTVTGQFDVALLEPGAEIQQRVTVLAGDDGELTLP